MPTAKVGFASGPTPKSLREEWMKKGEAQANRTFQTYVFEQLSRLKSTKHLNSILDDLAKNLLQSAHLLGFSPFCANADEIGAALKVTFEDCPWNEASVKISASLRCRFEGSPFQFLDYLNSKLTYLCQTLDSQKNMYVALRQEIYEKQAEAQVKSPKEELEIQPVIVPNSPKMKKISAVYLDDLIPDKGDPENI